MEVGGELDPERIRGALASGQLFFHDRIGSTNDWALAEIRSQRVQAPALVLAREQTAGRGQWDRNWISQRGNLTMSIVVETPEQAHWLPLVAGWGAAEAIEAVGDRRGNRDWAIELKWPNDLLLGNRKLGGILVESVAEPRFSVIGLGINVAAAPPMESIADSAHLPPTSLDDAFQWKWPLEELVIACAGRILGRVADLAGGLAPSELRKSLEQRLAFRGQEVRVELGNGNFRNGRLLGLGGRGQLCLTRDSDTWTVASGRILPISDP